MGGEELVARMRAVLKRYHKLEGDVRRCGPLEIDLAAHTVLRDGERVSLSSIQFKILEALVLKAGAVVTRDQIIDRVWGLDPPESPRSVDYHILQLRRKLEEDPEAPRRIVTEPGHGYRFEL